MHEDLREVTVSLEHLREACGEIGRAMGQTERSAAEAAARRAVDHLNLVIRRLEHAQSLPLRDEVLEAIDHAYSSTRMAWQGTHNALNNWEHQAARRLDAAKTQLSDAIGELEVVAPARAEAAHRVAA